MKSHNAYVKVSLSKHLLKILFQQPVKGITKIK